MLSEAPVDITGLAVAVSPGGLASKDANEYVHHEKGVLSAATGLNVGSSMDLIRQD